jgi:1,4-alpha-glucan branching enzyme
MRIPKAALARAAIAIALLACGACGVASGEDETTASGQSDLSSSWRRGMGAVAHEHGVTFRVWAPGARRVFVAGDFNGWNPDADELGNEFNGNFSTDVGHAHRWQKYRYVIETAWGERIWKSDPRAQRVENSDGASVIHDPGAYQWHSGFSMPSWNELVIYELHIGTFHDSPGWGPGTWRSAMQKLDYLRDLGINAVEIMPVAEFPGDFSWGYNPSFPFAPESSYGTPDDMKAFVDEAHARGIAVLLDVVHNHWGPTDLPTWCIAGECAGNGGPYFYTDDRRWTPWGETRPDYGRNEVRDFIKDSVRQWLDEYRIDGLRVDGTKYMRTIDGSRPIEAGYSLLQDMSTMVDRSAPWKLMIAEDFGGDFPTESTANGGLGFDAQWDGEFVHPMRAAITASNDAWRDMWRVRDAITHQYQGRASRRVIYTESHDEVANGRARVAEEIWPGHAGSWHSRKRSTLGAAITLTSPGIPLLFSGQEFVEDGYFRDDDPLDWNKAGWFSGIVRMYGDLIKLRRNWHDNTRGLRGDHVNVFHTNDSEKVIAYHRWDAGGPGDDVVVVANFSERTFRDYEIGFPGGGRWRVRLNTDAPSYAPDFGAVDVFDTDASGPPRDGMPRSARVNLPPYGVVILSQ